MSRDERIKSKLDFLEYVYQNYPQVLREYKNKIAGAYEAPADDTTGITTQRNQLQDGTEEYSF